MNKSQGRAVDISLGFLWLITGFVSAFVVPETGYGILASAGIEGGLADICVYGGAGLDLIIGIWLWIPKYRRLCYQVQGVVVLIFTLLLTVIAPSFWLHPFGPVTKNVPLLVLIWIRYQNLGGDES